MIVFSTDLVSEPVWLDSGPKASCDGLTSLVITGSLPLRERLQAIAVAAGAVCRAPAAVTAAWREAAKPHQLVFIDVAWPVGGSTTEAWGLAEAVAMHPGTLLAVCGRHLPAPAVNGWGAVDDECRARQLGAFVYLPGAGSDGGIALLFAEARRICSAR